MAHAALLREAFEDRTTGVIRRWLLAHQGVTPTTLATYDRSLRVTLNWFEKRGYVAVSPMKALPKRRTPRTRVDTFTLAEAQAISKRVKEGRHPRRDVALVTLLLDTGLRIGEAIGLKLEDVNWVEGYLHVTGKTGPRVVPFGRRTKAALKAYVDRKRKAASPRIRKLFLTRSGDPLTVDAGGQQVSRLVRGAGASRERTSVATPVRVRDDHEERGCGPTVPLYPRRAHLSYRRFRGSERVSNLEGVAALTSSEALRLERCRGRIEPGALWSGRRAE